MPDWRVKLPREVRPPFTVYVNGVPQEEGRDYKVAGRNLLFKKPLVQEGKLGFWRWFLGAWGVGTYRANHTIDVQYELNGRPHVAHALEVEPPEDWQPSGKEPGGTGGWGSGAG